MPNKLINQTSPYLLQHAHNPVNWHPWNSETLQIAKTQNKPLLISIGYAACHWCHIMEKESFLNTQIAEIMNQHFICIKVDREERPDVDMLYMNSLQAISQGGGWPLHAFALPDTTPFYLGTYFPPQQWTDLLTNLANLYKKDIYRIKQAAQQITQGINSLEKKLTNTQAQIEKKQYIQAISKWKKAFDPENGGNQGAPKFPMPSSLKFLMHYNHYFPDPEVETHIHNTLNHIASGGIYDHIRGGFARYSVDQYWHVPHFEKMLYDNAQLISLYSIAYKRTKAPQYKQIVQETIQFLITELQSPEGAFYASLDADTDHEEGKFYVWTKTEIQQILQDQAPQFIKFYNITEEGNWEKHKNIPYHTQTNDYYFSEELKQAKQKLYQHQNQRTRPALDNKIITSWNALTITALLDAYNTFQNPEYLQHALTCAKYITTKHTNKQNQLQRTRPTAQTQTPAFLDDYATLIQAHIQLAQTTNNHQWLQTATTLTQTVLSNFTDTNTPMFFFSKPIKNQEITPQKEITDTAIPASNSIMANNLFKLGILTENPQYTQHAKKMFSQVALKIAQSPIFYSNWAILGLKIHTPPFEIIITGPEAEKTHKELLTNFLPNTISLASAQESQHPLFKNRHQPNQTHIYPCQNNTCLLPVQTIQQLQKILNPKT